MKKGSRRPLFVVHTMGGNLFHYYDLARRLDAEQTVYGLQARGVYGTERPDHTIEAIAARCIESMRTVQPVGPISWPASRAGVSLHSRWRSSLPQRASRWRYLPCSIPMRRRSGHLGPGSPNWGDSAHAI